MAMPAPCTEIRIGTVHFSYSQKLSQKFSCFVPKEWAIAKRLGPLANVILSEVRWSGTTERESKDPENIESVNAGSGFLKMI